MARDVIIIIDRAKTRAATCRVCRNKIQRDEIRVHVTKPIRFQNERVDSVVYNHLACWNVPKGLKFEDVEIRTNNVNDVALVQQAISGELKVRELEKHALKVEEDDGSKTNEAKKTNNKPIEKEKIQQNKTSSRQQPSRKAKTTTSSSSSISLKRLKREEQPTTSTTTTTTKTKPKKQSRGGPGYFIPSALQDPPLLEIPPNHPLAKKFASYTTDDLKALLRHNGQFVTGRKKDLIARCIDGEMHGRIPGCGKCKKGQLRFNVASQEVKIFMQCNPKKKSNNVDVEYVV